MGTVYTLDDISKHTSKDDLWMTIDNKVYNVTNFVLEHPGGEEVLLDEAGKDATESFEDIGHSDEAREILKEYLVGTLAEECRKKHRFNVIRAGELPVEKKSGSAFRVIIPTIAVIGVLVYKFIIAPQSH
ncbi:cytochrome b5 [Pilobolus umbonatus]|nr:cytochrome b5 [Pilobolus umbonatus]